MRHYLKLKSDYLDLCRRHGLNPFDLDILHIMTSHLPRKDKVKLVSFVMQLISLERRLKRKIDQGLFPLTVEEWERSGYLTAKRKAS